MLFGEVRGRHQCQLAIVQLRIHVLAEQRRRFPGMRHHEQPAAEKQEQEQDAK